MGLIEVNVHDPEFTFAPFSRHGDTQPPGDTTESADAEGDTEDRSFPGDDATGGGKGGLLVLVAFVLAALVVRKLVKDTEELEDFGDETEE